MALSIKTRITQRLGELLATITRDNGYRTDMGRNVLISVRLANATELPGCVLMPGREIAVKRSGFRFHACDYQIFAFVNRLETPLEDYTAGPPEEYMLQDAMAADIIEVLESGDATLAALVDDITFSGLDPAEHEAGGEHTGVELVYTLTYAITTGDPESAP